MALLKPCCNHAGVSRMFSVLGPHCAACETLVYIKNSATHMLARMNKNGLRMARLCDKYSFAILHMFGCMPQGLSLIF